MIVLKFSGCLGLSESYLDINTDLKESVSVTVCIKSLDPIGLVTSWVSSNNLSSFLKISLG